MANFWEKDKPAKAVGVAQETAGAIQETVENVVQEGGSVLQSVVDQASQLMSSGAGFAADAAESFVEDVPEIAENVEERAGTLTETLTPSPQTLVEGLRFAAPVVSKLLPINAAKFAEFLSNDGKISITPEDLGDDVDFLREKAIETLTKGDNRFTYETWGFKEKSILMGDLKKTAAKSFSDPNYRMATLIGQTAKGNVRVEGGRIVVEDVYDFNTGPRGTKLQKALVLKETGDMEGYERLAEEALDDLSYFGQMRVWAAALGVPQGEGTRFKLDLGPAPEGLG